MKHFKSEQDYVDNNHMVKVGEEFTYINSDYYFKKGIKISYDGMSIPIGLSCRTVEAARTQT